MLRTVHEKQERHERIEGYSMHLSNLDDGLYLLFLYPVFFVLFVPFVDYAFLLGTCVTSVRLFELYHFIKTRSTHLRRSYRDAYK